jgi:periplasmic protein TonB
MPEIVNRVEPVYPPELKAQGIDGGYAIVHFVVERDGTLTQVRLGKESSPGFGASALGAVAKWKFKPAIKGDQPVRVMVTIILPFELPGK